LKKTTLRSLHRRFVSFKWLASGLQVICPTGKKTFARENLSRRRSKNIPLWIYPKSVASSRYPASSKRGVRVVTNVEAGCGGRGAAADD
jgi:hypothetical protein